MAIIATRRALLGMNMGGSPVVVFNLALADLGAGAVNTTPTVVGGSGTPTFTRATTAWTKLSTGLWASVASGTARSTYIGANTAVGVYGGYFSEAAGTQLVTPSASIRDMTNAAWVKVTMTTAKTSTGIDGTATSCTRCTASAGNATILQTLVAAASTRTYSCWIKRVTGTGEIDISEDGSTWTNITSQINSSTFTRVSITVSQLNAAFGIRIVTNTDAIDVDFNQFEAGLFATSPMDAAGAVRNADVLTYLAAGNIVSSSGSVYAEVSTNNDNTKEGGVLDWGNNYPLGTQAQPAGQYRGEIYDGTNDLFGTTGGATETVGKIASSWGAAGCAIVLNAGTVATGAFDGDISNGATIAIGSRGGVAGWLNGTVKNVRIYNGQLSNGALVGLTT